MSNSSSFSFFESKMGGIPKNNFPPLNLQHYKMESDSRSGHNFIPSTIFDPNDVTILNWITSQHQNTAGNLFDYEYLASNSTAACGDLFKASDQILRTADVTASSIGINLSGFRSTQVNAPSASNHYDCWQTFPDEAFENLNNSTIKRNFLDIVSELEQSNPKKQQYTEKVDPFISFQFQQPNGSISDGEQDAEAIAQMKEIIYREAAFRPVNFDVEAVEKPKRRNVRTSKDPQTVAARQRREKISERIRVLQKLVPGGSQMDTASMLDEAANYLKFLRSLVKELETLGGKRKEMENWGTTADNYLACPSSMHPISMPSYFCSTI